MTSATQTAPAELKLGRRTFVLPYADLLPALDDETYQALKRDVEQHGIRVPINVETLSADQFRVIDGHHRLRIAQELGLDWNEVPLHRDLYASDDEREDMAWALNAHRRQLTREQRQAHALRLRQRGLSYRDIAERLGVDPMTARSDVKSTVENSTVPLPDTITGRDGKERPAVMPRPVPAPEVAPAPGESPAAKINGQDAIDNHLATLREDVWKDAPRTLWQGGAAWCIKCHQVHEEWELVCVSGLNVWHCKRCEFNTPDSHMTASAPAPIPTPPPATESDPVTTKRKHDALWSSSEKDWHTPPDLLDLARRVLGTIDLDPASDAVANERVQAARYFDIETNGLAQSWANPDGSPARVWLNPPYGDGIIELWIDKLLAEQAAGHIKACLLLVAARTETIWMGKLYPYPRCFISGRVRFIPGPTNPLSGSTGPGFPSVVIYLGEDLNAFAEAFSERGDVYTLFKSLAGKRKE